MNDLIKLLEENAVTKGSVTLASGIESNFYIDCKKVLLTKYGSSKVGSVLKYYFTYNPTSAKIIAGEGIGGIALAMIALYNTDCFTNTLLIRKSEKDHGTSKGNIIEGIQNVSAGSEVLLIEDVVTSGKSVLQAAKKLKLSGFKVVNILSLIDRQEGGNFLLEKEGYNYNYILTKEDFIYE